jgi:hypothetical protein
MTQPSAVAAPPLSVFVEGIGLLGPGLSNWAQGRGVLEGTGTYQPARCVVPLPMSP